LHVQPKSTIYKRIPPVNCIHLNTQKTYDHWQLSPYHKKTQRTRCVFELVMMDDGLSHIHFLCTGTYWVSCCDFVIWFFSFYYLCFVYNYNIQ